MAPPLNVNSVLSSLGHRLRISQDDLRSLSNKFAETFANLDQGTGYRDLPPRFGELIHEAQTDQHKENLSALVDLVLVTLASDFDTRFRRAELPRSLLPYYAQNIDRILQRAAQGKPWAHTIHDDIFLKDLGILRMTLIPCASHLIYRHSGVPRSLTLRQSPTQILSAISFFGLRCHGFAPFIENHVHLAMLEHFNPAGREQCYRLVAELLERWPENRGLMGLSWYYDPAVSRISPHLAYLHDVPESGGALFLPAGSGPDVIGGATSTSRSRRKLFEEGSYTPTRYLMAWSRDDILRRYKT